MAPFSADPFDSVLGSVRGRGGAATSSSGYEGAPHSDAPGVLESELTRELAQLADDLVAVASGEELRIVLGRVAEPLGFEVAEVWVKNHGRHLMLRLTQRGMTVGALELLLTKDSSVANVGAGGAPSYRLQSAWTYELTRRINGTP
jgi:hypothetical protein